MLPGPMTPLCPVLPQLARCCAFWRSAFLSWKLSSLVMFIFLGVALRRNFSFPPVAAAAVKHCSGCKEEEELQHKATVFASKVSNSSELWLGGHT